MLINIYTGWLLEYDSLDVYGGQIDYVHVTHPPLIFEAHRTFMQVRFSAPPGSRTHARQA